CKQKSEEFGNTDASPVPVLTQFVIEEKVRLPIVAEGLVSPISQVNITALTSGIIEKLNFKVGDRVKKGEVLATFDARYLTLNWVEDGLELIAEREQLISLQNAAAAGKASTEEVKRQQEKVSLLTDIYYNSKYARSKNDITANLDGRIITWHISAGDSVRAGQAVGIVANYDPDAIARIELTEPDYYSLTVNDSASLIPAAKPDLRLDGKVISRDINDNSAGLPYTAKIRFENPGALAALGSKVSISIKGNKESVVILAPQDALTERDGKSASVFLVAGKGRFAARRHVLLGPEIGYRIVIEKGLRKGEQLIIQGVDHLDHGTPVMLIQ
ncbi:efflux RND transporter periplasmic adaptor subunit, partial [bacterium]|nr:efflux RND transporter periplasmic adaptor subunit [bacterium]